MQHARGTDEQRSGDRAARACALSAFACLVFAVLLFAAAPAFAGNEGGSTDPERVDCEQCHSNSITPDKGPHGFYNDVTATKCSTCHRVHTATGSILLLPRNTLRDSCNACHDGTGGQGVYGSLAARGLAVGGSHRIDTTNTIPGGSDLSGQETTRAFFGTGGLLSCGDCHNPHDAGTVNVFRSERFRGGLGLSMGYVYPDAGATSKLLKQLPSGATTATTEYGSDWCAACHNGRTSGGMVRNHPVDSTLRAAGPFTYNNVALVASDSTTKSTVLGAMTRLYSGRPTNRGYLMPWPRTAHQTGHAPICQQCHEDSRNAGTLSDLGADPATFSVTATAFAGQYPVTDNPRFQNFPHETANTRMLVENADDLCTNCHPATALP